MKVEIKQYETDVPIAKKTFFGGWKNSKEMKHHYCVLYTVTLSEEEKQVLTKLNAWDYELYQQPNTLPPSLREGEFAGATLPVTVARFLEHNDKYFDTPAEANEFTHRLKTTILPNLKNFITSNTTPSTGTENFEL